MVERLAELSGGKLTVTTFPAGALNSSPSSQYSLLRNGMADIALTVQAYTPDLFPNTDLIGFPGVRKIRSAALRGYPI
ncbi:MAG: hypothetical protein OXN89_21255 [Bryobacterales bacterium]|nr:hypothetical protein [Bryobacterales bacterium]